MSNTYSPSQFKNALLKKLKNHIPSCTICGHNQFTMTNDFVSHFCQNTYGTISIGKNVPTGFIICNNCGHIEFFSLGVLGLLNADDKGDCNNE